MKATRALLFAADGLCVRACACFGGESGRRARQEKVERAERPVKHDSQCGATESPGEMMYERGGSHRQPVVSGGDWGIAPGAAAECIKRRPALVLLSPISAGSGALFVALCLEHVCHRHWLVGWPLVRELALPRGLARDLLLSVVCHHVPLAAHIQQPAVCLHGAGQFSFRECARAHFWHTQQ